MTILVTYSNELMTIAADICKASALINNVHKVSHWKRQDILKTKFYKANKNILDSPRGDGFWCWKPFIILEELKNAKEHDVIVYCDAGVEIVNNINHIIDRMTGDIWLFGNKFQHVHWCKGDALMPNFDFYNDKYHYQVQASVIVIRNTKNARLFIEAWLHHCCKPGLIDDSASKLPNHPEFREHRHDQSILTSLAYINLLPFHWWPAMYNCGAFTYSKEGYNDNYPVLFHHHRCRNNEIQQPGMFRDYFHKKYPSIV